MNNEEKDIKSKIIKSKYKPKKCPVCKFKPVASIFYGYPIMNDDLEEKIKLGKIVLGGCFVEPESPEWECSNCGTQFKRIRENDYLI